MIWLLLFLCLFNRISSNDEENNKYIDLLPESEKQEFLDRIARRIMDKIKSNGNPKKSELEVADEELDAQTAFVNGILKEEAEKFKNKKQRNTVLNDNVTEIKEISEYGENNVSVTRRETRQDYFSVRPLVPSPTWPDFPYATVPVETILDREIENFDLRNNINTDEVYNNTTAEEVMSSTPLVKTTTENIIEENTATTLIQESDITINSEYTTTGRVSVKEYMKEAKTTEAEGKNNLKDPVLDTSTTNINTNKSQENYRFDKINNNVTDVYSTVATTSAVVILNNTISSSKSYPVQRKNISNETNIDTDNIKQESVQHPVRKDLNLDNFEIYDNDANVSSTFESHETTKDFLKEGNIQDQNESSTINNKVMSISTYKYFGRERSAKSQKQENTNININLFLNGPSDRTSTGNKSKDYEVYEIDPRNPPFVPMVDVQQTTPPDVIQVEKPYVASVYDYNPSNAYFDPHNRFGLDTENENSDKVSYITFESKEENALRSPYSSTNNRVPINEFYLPDLYGQNRFDAIPRAAQIYHTIHLNPDDYRDQDYYSGRINKDSDRLLKFPDSSEKSHPYNRIHKSDSIKDHITAIRNLLYKQQRFGYIPELNKNDTTIYNKAALLRTRNDQGKYNAPVSMDYYYGRLNTDGIAFNGHIGKKAVILSKFLGPMVAVTENAIQSDLSKQIAVNGKTNKKIKNKTHEVYSGEEVDLKALLNVLRDMIREENKDLVNHAWIQSTIDIRVTIRIIFELIDRYTSTEAKYKIYNNNEDIQFLKFVLYLYKSAKKELSKEFHKSIPQKHQHTIISPREIHKVAHPYMLKDLFEFRRSHDLLNDRLVDELWNFIDEILFQLEEFHEAITQTTVSMSVASYDWFEGLKKLYLKEPVTPKLTKLLLHLHVANVFKTITDNRRYIRSGYKRFIVSHPEEVRNCTKEFSFVIKLVNELQYM